MNIKAWIQSSDESNNDFVLNNGEIVAVEDQHLRQEYVNQMFHIKDNGKEILKDNHLKITKSKQGNLFLIDMLADNKDIHGRRIAIMLLVEEYAETNESEFENLIGKTFEMGQTEVSKETIEKIKDTLKKNVANSLGAINGKAIAIAVGVLLFILLLIKMLS